MAIVLFGPGDRVPQLELQRAERIEPGDVVWGFQWQDNLRKGLLLETEGVEVVYGALPLRDGTVKIGSWAPVDRDRMVLIEVH